jgi:hypothetical protein
MKINYVIAAWGGARRDGGDGLGALRKQVSQLQLLKHDLAQITVVVPCDPSEPPGFTTFIELLKWGRLPVVILRRPENTGLSYGSWSHAYDVYGKAFDYYLFMEDDYYFVEDHFDRTLVELLGTHGLVCGFVSRAGGREWPGNSNGMASSAALEAVKARYGHLPYDTDASGGNYTLESGQVTWGAAFQLCGYTIGDITSRYACLHWYWQRQKCDLIPGQPWRGRFLFVPYQAPLNYPFIPFKGRHEGEDAILYGTGPSLNDYDYLEDDGLRVRVGLNSFIAEGRPLDYYFFGHMDKRSSEYLQNVKDFKGVKFGFTSVDGMGTGTWLDSRQALSLGALPYHLSTGLTYHDDITANPLVDHAINFSALQFLVHTGVRKIHLVGCDASSILSHKSPEVDTNRDVGVMVSVWNEFAAFVRDRVEVVSVNPVGLKDMFPARYTQNRQPEGGV